MRWFWAMILVLSVIGIAWYVYSIVTGAQQKEQWWMILLASIGLLAALNGTHSSFRKLLDI